QSELRVVELLPGLLEVGRRALRHLVEAAQLEGNDVALRVPVQETEEERAARALRLGDQEQRLVDPNDVIRQRDRHGRTSAAASARSWRWPSMRSISARSSAGSWSRRESGPRLAPPPPAGPGSSSSPSSAAS